MKPQNKRVFGSCLYNLQLCELSPLTNRPGEVSLQERSCPSHPPTSTRERAMISIVPGTVPLPCRTDVLMSEPAKVRWCGANAIATVLGYEPAGETSRRGLQQQQPADHLDDFLQHHHLHCYLQAVPLILETPVEVVSVRKPVPVAAPQSGSGKEVRRLFQPSTHHRSTNRQRQFEMCNLISSFFVVRAPWAPFTALRAYVGHSGLGPPGPAGNFDLQA